MPTNLNRNDAPLFNVCTAGRVRRSEDTADGNRVVDDAFDENVRKRGGDHSRVAIGLVEFAGGQAQMNLL